MRGEPRLSRGVLRLSPGVRRPSPGARRPLRGAALWRCAVTRFLVVLTDIRPITEHRRDERLEPERRRQVVGASNREAAERIAAAFSSLGMVRAGRQRVKVLAVGRRIGG